MPRRRFEDDDRESTPPKSSHGPVILAFAAGMSGLVLIGLLAVGVGMYALFAGRSEPPAPPPRVVADSGRVQHVDPPISVIEPPAPTPDPLPPPIADPAPAPIPPPPMPFVPPNTGVASSPPAPRAPVPVPPKPKRAKFPSAKLDRKIDVDGMKGILSEEYPKPKELTGVASNYIKVVSSKGDYIGQGENYVYDLTVSNIRPSNYGGGIAINVGGWHLEFAPPRRRGNQTETLKVGVHRDAARFPFNDDVPGLSFSGNGRGSNTLAGSYVIWELELDGDEVVSFAADFVQRSEKTGPPLYGRVRYNSKFE